MKRRLNYTNRRKISRENVEILLHSESSESQRLRFSASISIPSEWALSPDARVYVEPYTGPSSMRFAFGTVSALTPPTDTWLTDLDVGAPILFRVKIVDEHEGVGLLLASVDELKAENDKPDRTQIRAIFPLVLTDLGSLVWRVYVSREDRPVLQINNRIPGLREELLSNPLLQGAILPAALRQVLDALLRSDEYEEMGWVTDWRRFISELGAEDLPEADEDVDSSTLDKIIDSAVAIFAEKKAFVQRARSQFEGASNG